jgi:hypothetical protein
MKNAPKRGYKNSGKMKKPSPAGEGGTRSVTDEVFFAF